MRNWRNYIKIGCSSVETSIGQSTKAVIINSQIQCKKQVIWKKMFSSSET